MLIFAAAKWAPSPQPTAAPPLLVSLDAWGSCHSFVLFSWLPGPQGNGLSVVRPTGTSPGRPDFPSWLPPPSPDPKVPPAHPPAPAKPPAQGEVRLEYLGPVAAGDSQPLPSPSPSGCAKQARQLLFPQRSCWQSSGSSRRRWSGDSAP